MVEDAKGKVRRFQDYTFVHQAMTNKIKFDGLLGPPPALIGLIDQVKFYVLFSMKASPKNWFKTLKALTWICLILFHSSYIWI